MVAEEDICWFALKVFHNKVFRAEELFKERGIETYLPTHNVMVERNGERKSVRRAVIPSLMFVRTTASRVIELERELSLRVPMYVYRHREAELTRRPAAIPQRQMEMFILVSSSGEKGLDYLDASQLDLSVGNKVRVIDGIFKGSEGHIKRIKGNRRFIVCINGICAVATPYIPVAFLEKIE